ncbi:MAG: hypothetical protein U5K72_15760 [Balneolaceae bacterium]|nr:hypothetical protein [Balneolaceae bacterium]
MSEMKKYEYRRQFIAGSHFRGENEYWQHIDVAKNLKLSVHKDLPVQVIQREEKQLFLLGYIIDPFHPDRTDADIIEWLFEKSADASTLIENTYRLSGRWILIYVDDGEITFFHDPFGMRQIYYAKVEGNIWCASDPAILADYLNLKPDEEDEEKIKFIHSSAFEKKERFWVGDKTRYREIQHLLPNHYLEINTGFVHRYWMNNEPTISADEAAKRAGDLLKGSLLSAKKRFNLMMPVTAGWDSRALLSATKKIKDEIFYFISTKNQLTEEDEDVKIPQKLFKKLRVDFHLLDNLKHPDEDFLKTLHKNVDLARNLPKTLTFYEFYLNHQEKVNINGRGAETARSYYPFEKNPAPEFLAKVTGYPNSEFVLEEINSWINETRPIISENNIDMVDLYYWEQRMGNWGGTDPAEQDIAIEEFCPFNNRKLMMILLSTNKKYRIRPNYRLHNMIISYLWKDILREPINPMPKLLYFKMLINSKISSNLKSKIKRLLGMHPYD